MQGQQLVITSSLSLCFLSVGEPDSPVLSSDEMKVEGNSFSVPLKQIDDGGTPLKHFNIRYGQVRDGVRESVCLCLLRPYCPLTCTFFMRSQDKEGTEWKETQLSPDADSISLQDLSFGSGYQLEVTAVNANGSSIPATFNFTIAEQPGMWPPAPYTIHFSLLARECGLNYTSVLCVV